MRERKNMRMENELRRLKRENEYLRHRLASLGEQASEGEDRYALRFSEMSRMASSVHRRSYAAYLLHRIRVSFVFRLWDRTRFAVRSVFWATKIWNFLVWFFVLLGFGTQFLLFMSVTAILLPALLITAMTIGVFGFFAHKKQKKKFLAFLKKGDFLRIFVVFVPKTWKKHAYFHFFVSELEKNGLVILVSDSFAACGYKGVSFLSETRCVMHISYYFSLKTCFFGEIVCIY